MDPYFFSPFVIIESVRITFSNFLIKTHFNFSCYSHNRDFQNRQPTKQPYIQHLLSVRHSANSFVLHNEAAIKTKQNYNRNRKRGASEDITHHASSRVIYDASPTPAPAREIPSISCVAVCMTAAVMNKAFRTAIYRAIHGFLTQLYGMKTP